MDAKRRVSAGCAGRNSIVVELQQSYVDAIIARIQMLTESVSATGVEAASKLKCEERDYKLFYP